MEHDHGDGPCDVRAEPDGGFAATWKCTCGVTGRATRQRAGESLRAAARRGWRAHVHRQASEGGQT